MSLCLGESPGSLAELDWGPEAGSERWEPGPPRGEQGRQVGGAGRWPRCWTPLWAAPGRPAWTGPVGQRVGRQPPFRSLVCGFLAPSRGRRGCVQRGPPGERRGGLRGIPTERSFCPSIALTATLLPTFMYWATAVSPTLLTSILSGFHNILECEAKGLMIYPKADLSYPCLKKCLPITLNVPALQPRLRPLYQLPRPPPASAPLSLSSSSEVCCSKSSLLHSMCPTTDRLGGCTKRWNSQLFIHTSCSFVLRSPPDGIFKTSTRVPSSLCDLGQVAAPL